MEEIAEGWHEMEDKIKFVVVVVVVVVRRAVERLSLYRR